MSRRTFADLMEPSPRPWGMRGDPLLWEAMKEVLDGKPLPQNEAELSAAFASSFETLTGQALDTAPDHFPVRWTRRENGGMSNGLVSRAYWQLRLLPAMIERLHAAHRSAS